MLKNYIFLCFILSATAYAQPTGRPPGGGNMSQCMSEIEALGCGKPDRSNSSFRTCIESNRSKLSAQCQKMGQGGPRPGAGRPGGSQQGPGRKPPTADATPAPTPKAATKEIHAPGEQRTQSANTTSDQSSTETTNDCLSVVDGERELQQDRDISPAKKGTSSGLAVPQ